MFANIVPRSLREAFSIQDAPTPAPTLTPALPQKQKPLGRGKAGLLRSRVLDFIDRNCFPALGANGGVICEEVEKALNLTHQSASARINELMHAGYIFDSDKKRVASTGRKQTVWRKVFGAPRPVPYKRKAFSVPEVKNVTVTTVNPHPPRAETIAEKFD
jgi:hypothetical protein